MTKNNRKKWHESSKRRHSRAVLLIVAVLLTITAAGCSGKPSKQTGNPTGAPTGEATPEPTKETELTPTPEPTKEAELTPTPEPTKEAEPTLTPEPTKEAEPTPTPEPTKEAEPTPTPEPTKEAELTPTPEPTKEAEPTPTPTPEPTPTKEAEPTPKPSPTPSGSGGNTVEISKANVGDTVRFGSYEQDDDTANGKEAIEWLVLDKQDGKLLLLSKYVLDAKPYNEEDETVTWETCTLRGWLNGTFYTTAFSQTEQGRIATTKVKNEDNPEDGTEGGNNTEDKVFLLSIGEAGSYFDSDSARCARGTAYAKAQNVLQLNSTGNAWWWLRSSGFTDYYAVIVYIGGYLNLDGIDVYLGNGGVRPAFWLNLES